MPIEIKPFMGTDQEYETMSAISYAVWPDHPTTVEEYKHTDKTWNHEKYLFQRVIVWLNGKAVGAGSYYEPAWTYRPGKYYVEIEVHPDYQGRGLGKVWYRYVMDKLAERGADTIIITTREDKPRSIRFLQDREYKMIMREPRSELYVPSFDFEAFAWTDQKMTQEGIALVSLAELAEHDTNWKHNLNELLWELDKDVPADEPPTKMTVEEMEKEWLSRLNFDPQAKFVALHGKQYVGYSGIWPSLADSKRSGTGLTGVVRSHRRKGVATALKTAVIRYAHQTGIEHIVTENEENNPMYQLNLQLGYKPCPAWLEYKKVI